MKYDYHPLNGERPLLTIFQAVIRVSKAYLPHMSSLLSSSKVTVFVGDGFEFLAKNEATYDVIITDSSDPVGPAESLFQQPYFQLLYNALAPGGNISTQGECLWLHLPLILGLRNMARSTFPVSEYAYTTVPTYPSGQIGFVVCSKDPNRNVKVPLRKVENTKLYNGDLHRSAFNLPEFVRVMLEENKYISPTFGRAAAAAALHGKPTKKVLLLGSGFVARPCAEYITRNPLNELTIGQHVTPSFDFHLHSLFCSLQDPGSREKDGIGVAKHDRDLSRREVNLGT
jgi:spermidine synthase / saccharopine dehydrogenase (NADP+, L-glutamate-forming)